MKNAEQKAVLNFNLEFPVGTRFRYWRGVKEGPGLIGETSCEAFILGGHTACVMFKLGGGAIALTHVEPIMQDLPVTMRAEG